MAIDRVHPLKLEDPTTGGDQIDQFPTELNPLEDHIECAGLVIDDTDNRDEAVRIYRTGDDMMFMDVNNPTPSTLSDLLAGGGGGLTEEQHRLLPQSTHWIDQNSYDEVTRSGGKVTSVVTWESPSKVRKIREELITRISGYVSQLVTLNYDGSGVLHETLTEVFTRTSGRVVNIARTRV
jgi:hypothetical protein